MKRHEIVDFYLKKAEQEKKPWFDIDRLLANQKKRRTPPECEKTANEIDHRLIQTGAIAMNFWAGFEKKAADTYVQAAQPDPMLEEGNLGVVPPEKMLKWNEQGGVDPRTPEDMAKSEAVRLVTLPHEVEGASCGNCVHFRALNPELGSGFCTNPEVQQDVTNRMLCGAWEHPGTYSAAQEMAEEQVMQQQADEQAAAAGQAYADGNPMAQDIMSDFNGGGGEEMPVGPDGQPMAPEGEDPSMGADPGAGAAKSKPEGGSSKPKPKSKPKKDSDSGDSGTKSENKDGHTINIHMGKDKEKVATESFLSGFVGRMR